jgi:hypothetical protein
MRNQKTPLQEQLLREYRKEMRRANDKLRALEKLADDPDYEGVLKFAYRVAQRDIKEFGLGDPDLVRYRIPYDPKTGKYNTNKLKAMLKRVQAFNDMPTSSKASIKKLYMKDASNFNKAFGTNFTWQELRTFTKASDWDRLKLEYGSDVLVNTIRNYINKQKKKVNNAAEKVADASMKHKVITKETSVADDWMKRLEEQGLRVDLLHYGTGEFTPAYDDESPFID